VAGVDRIGRGDFGGADDGWNMQVTLRRRSRPDAHGLVGEPNVERARVDFGVHGDGLHAELAARAQDAERDLAAVRDENFSEHAYAFLMRKSFCPNSTALPFCAKHSM